MFQKRDRDQNQQQLVQPAPKQLRLFGNLSVPAMGQIRVGRCIYDRAGKRTDPSFDGFTPILVLTKSSAYGALGPYVLKNKKGQIMEDIYQFSKESYKRLMCKHIICKLTSFISIDLSICSCNQ
jgi:hypothetical protein